MFPRLRDVNLARGEPSTLIHRPEVESVGWGWRFGGCQGHDCGPEPVVRVVVDAAVVPVVVVAIVAGDVVVARAVVSGVAAGRDGQGEHGGDGENEREEQVFERTHDIPPAN